MHLELGLIYPGNFDRRVQQVGEQPPQDPGEGDDPEVVRLRTSIGKALRKARREVGLTQVQMSQLTGMSQQTVSAIECGRQNPTLPALVLLTRAIGYHLDIIIRPLRNQPQR